jgi:hypothetical protein
MEIFKINNDLLSKLNGVKNECSDYLENLIKRKTIILNLNNETDKFAMDFRDWKIKEYEKMIKKSDDQLFSSKIDLITQLEDLLTDLKK